MFKIFVVQEFDLRLNFEHSFKKLIFSPSFFFPSTIFSISLTSAESATLEHTVCFSSGRSSGLYKTCHGKYAGNSINWHKVFRIEVKGLSDFGQGCGIPGSAQATSREGCRGCLKHPQIEQNSWGQESDCNAVWKDWQRKLARILEPILNFPRKQQQQQTD